VKALQLQLQQQLALQTQQQLKQPTQSQSTKARSTGRKRKRSRGGTTTTQKTGATVFRNRQPPEILPKSQPLLLPHGLAGGRGIVVNMGGAVVVGEKPQLTDNLKKEAETPNTNMNATIGLSEQALNDLRVWYTSHFRDSKWPDRWFDSDWVEFHHHFRKLLEYKSRFGHTRVSRNWKEDTKLGRWVKKIKRSQRDGRIPPEYVDKLASVDFTWTIPRTQAHKSPVSWKKRFLELQKFKERFGHAEVPQNWEENVPLALWVEKQRRLRNRSKMTRERTLLLNQLAFCWDAPTSPPNPATPPTVKAIPLQVPLAASGKKQEEDVVITERTEERDGEYADIKIPGFDEVGKRKCSEVFIQNLFVA